MVKRGIPDRWLDYQALGNIIRGTQIVAFKVPLKTILCQQHLTEKEWFTPAMLLEKQPNLKTVIDLTNTFRYYNGEEEFGTKGVDHVKIMVEGRGTIPSVLQLQQFFAAMDDHMEKYRDNTDALIGVHCTHGLNRTGYFVCRWMLERMNISPEDAIERFNAARGHPIEREHLLDDLKSNNPPVPRLLPTLNSSYPPINHSDRSHNYNTDYDRTSRRTAYGYGHRPDTSLPPPRRTGDYRSPLEDSSYDQPSRGSRYGRYRGRPPQRSNDYRSPLEEPRYEASSGVRYGTHHARKRDRDITREGQDNNGYIHRDRSRGGNFDREEGMSRGGRFGGARPARSDNDRDWRSRDKDSGGNLERNPHRQNSRDRYRNSKQHKSRM